MKKCMFFSLLFVSAMNINAGHEEGNGPDLTQLPHALTSLGKGMAQDAKTVAKDTCHDCAVVCAGGVAATLCCLGTANYCPTTCAITTVAAAAAFAAKQFISVQPTTTFTKNK